MGTSNLDGLIMSPPPEFSDLDYRKKLSNIQDHRCNLSPPTPLQINNIQENQTKNNNNNNDNEDGNPIVSGGSLKIQVIKSFSNDDYPKTPTSREHKIPVMAACPPPPRKPKWVPNGKRKAPFFVAVGDPVADFMVYVDAMLALNEVVYVPDIVVGDLAAGDCAKRLKTTG